MTYQYHPEQMYGLGYTDLISVIPPGAQLTPTSKIAANQVGKVPGRRGGNGLWGGYDWRKHRATAEDVRQWFHDRANVGLRADRFPGVDIDCSDERISKIIEDAALAKLGPAPIRTGRYPKRLLMYRATEPFGRMRLWIERTVKGEKIHHLVEILGQGQQFVVYGTHPATGRAYEWDVPNTPAGDLTPISREQADAFLQYLGELLDMLSVGTVEREGDGRPLTRTAAASQKGLEAPSLELLREAVDLIPNSNTLFPDRTSYLKMGYAIRAACGVDDEEGFDIFSAWAGKWEGNDRFPSGNDPDVVRQDWKRIRGPYAVGWSWIAEQARGYGFADAALEFEADAPPPAADESVNAQFLSDQWLALKVVERRRGEIRYVPALDRWLVWNRSRWQPDAALLAEDLVKAELRRIAKEVAAMGASDKEIAEYQKEAKSICSQAKASAVRTLVQSDRGIALDPASLDHDSWIVNTPAGMVNLRTGELVTADPDQLCTKSTAVSPEFKGEPTRWLTFLDEATAGDKELQGYLQRLAGYALTGSTREQHLTFIWGPGGNGKGVFVNTLLGILGDYAKVATMDVFTASSQDKHSTDLAMLAGARLVTASETQAGKRWDEAKVKSMTGGDPITARFMRQDNFTYMPQFKLIFLGNHKPEIRDIDQAMRRRIHIVPFTVQPKVVDKELTLKLREEWPAILAWIIDGCLAWQRDGLVPPTSVSAATAEYFAENDPFGQWMEECVEDDPEGTELSTALFDSWREWANRNGEHVGSLRRLVQSLAGRRLRKWKHPKTRQAGFAGIRIKPAEPHEGMA